MAGMLTGISGGVIRDVLCNQVPVVFRRELYASVSLAVCLLFLGLQSLGLERNGNVLLCFAAGFAFRMLALQRAWHLPTFSYAQRWE